MKYITLAFAVIGLSGCTNLDAFKEQTEKQLQPNVSLLHKECLSAVVTGKFDEQVLLDAGLEKIRDDEKKIGYDNHLPKKGKYGVLTGTGMTLEFQPVKSKCKFGIRGDGFPYTVAKLMGRSGTRPEMKALYAQQDEIRVDIKRSGTLSLYTTTVSLWKED